MIDERERKEKLEDEIDAGLHDLTEKYEDGWDEDVKE